MKIIHKWIVRPFVYCELPGWGKLYNHFVGDYRRDADWQNEAPRLIRGKLHPYTMDLNLSNWSERSTFFLGRFYDLELQLFLKLILRPGDRFVDIGGNIGMVSLLASHLVGESGIVDTVEPNPTCLARINAVIHRNQIKNVRLHGCALGRETTTATLSIPEHNSGEATLTQLSEDLINIRSVTVPVKRGDDVLADDHRPPTMIKIDVEGFEYETLSGLSKTLTTSSPPIVVAEVVGTHLGRAGRSPSDLFLLMSDLGYEAFNLSLRRRRGFQRLIISDASLDRHDNNVVWCHPQHPSANVLMHNARE